MELSESKPASSGRLIAVIVVIGLLAGAGLGLLVFRGNPAAPAATTSGASVETAAGGRVGLAVGDIAPDFTLRDAVTGQEVTLSDYRGRPVLVNFWATWCAPCRLEMPFIEAAYQGHRDEGLAVLAVDADEPQQAVVAFGKELGLSFNLLLDPGSKVQDLYRIRGYPSSYFVAPDATLAAIHVGVMTEGQVAENLALIVP